MKKKLIAALTSAAMVATMVPATAFAASTQPVTTASDTKVTQQKASPKAASDLTEPTATAFWDAVKVLPEADAMTTWNEATDRDVVDAVDAYAAIAKCSGQAIL